MTNRGFCDHCRLPLGPGLLCSRPDPGEKRFCCSGCALAYQIVGDQGDAGEASWILARLGLGIILAMNLMLFNFLFYTDAFHGAEEGVIPTIHLIMFALATPIIILLGAPYFRNATRQALRLEFSMDSLIALGSLAAYAYSTYVVFAKTGGGVYFDTGSMILVLVTLGKFLEATAKAKSSQGIRRLLEMGSKEATVLRNGEEARVSLESVETGDLVKVLPGEKIPVDGVVVEGAPRIDEAALTGESRPVRKNFGQPVFGATVNTDSMFIFRVTGVGENTVLAQMVRLMEAALARRGRIQELVDRVSGIFVPLIVLVAAGTFVTWMPRAGTEHAFLMALAVLVIACPCALGLAAPMVTTLAIGRAAREGILIRSGQTLERLPKLSRIFFDKTGTLTLGRMSFVHTITSDEPSCPESLVLAAAATLESASEHSLAKSLTQHAKTAGIPLGKTEGALAVPGRGVEGLVTLPDPAWSPTRVFIGNAAFMAERGIDLTSGLSSRAEALENEGMTVVFCAWDGRARAALAFGDQLRPESAEAVRLAEARGLKTTILTGDQPAVANGVGARVGISDIRSRLLPQDKVAAIRAAQASGEIVAMAGDGINDAPAMAQADVGIAVGSGTDLAKETADISILGSDLRKIAWMKDLSRAAYRKIKENLFWAFIYNVIGVGLAAMGMIKPVLAALAMILSSLFVVGNSLSLNNWGWRRAATEGSFPAVEGAGRPMTEANRLKGKTA